MRNGIPRCIRGNGSAKRRLALDADTFIEHSWSVSTSSMQDSFGPRGIDLPISFPSSIPPFLLPPLPSPYSPKDPFSPVSLSSVSSDPRTLLLIEMGYPAYIMDW